MIAHLERRSLLPLGPEKQKCGILMGACSRSEPSAAMGDRSEDRSEDRCLMCEATCTAKSQESNQRICVPRQGHMYP